MPSGGRLVTNFSCKRGEQRYLFFWWLVSYSQKALCGLKFDTFCGKVNLTHLKQRSREIYVKSWKKLAKVGKVVKSCHKLARNAKTMRLAVQLKTHKATCCSRNHLEYWWAATIYATRFPTRYPDLFLLPYPNPTRSKKTYPSQPARGKVKF